ncbi:hypothetical protein ACIOWI_08190 [Streptomyces sp. NPDC087659]|uniref:hypothetical protein n=1 Tax=Streptomyces sp. NPDC087659 TaxID=3365801 RepID=UPI0037F7F46F
MTPPWTGGQRAPGEDGQHDRDQQFEGLADGGDRHAGPFGRGRGPGQPRRHTGHEPSAEPTAQRDGALQGRLGRLAESVAHLAGLTGRLRGVLQFARQGGHRGADDGRGRTGVGVEGVRDLLEPVVAEFVQDLLLK